MGPFQFETHKITTSRQSLGQTLGIGQAAGGSVHVLSLLFLTRGFGFESQTRQPLSEALLPPGGANADLQRRGTAALKRN